MIRKKVHGSIMNFANMSESQSGDNSITAFVEVSPAEATHSVGDYIIYNHIVYQVIDDIDILDILIVDSNIEVATLPEGTVIYSDDEYGSSGPLSYNDLSNKPQINNVELESGNNSLSALGIQGVLTFDNAPTDGSNNPVKSDGIYDSEKDIYAVMGEMGAKNLIPYPGKDTTKTVNDVTFTDNGDGTITVLTEAGGATGDSTFMFCSRSDRNVTIPAGKYKLTGCPTGGSGSTYSLQIGSYVHGTTNSGTGWTETGTGSIKLTNDMLDIGVYIQIKSGTIITTPITFKPMLRLASDTDDTYQQYAKTNKQLTDEIANKVDKEAGKGLSENDYSDSEKGKVTANAEAIEAMVNVLGAKNQFALAYNLGTTGLSTVNDELKNTLTDTVSSFILHFRGIKNDDTQDFLFGDVISSAGNYEYTVTITSNYKSLFFKHNGTSQDLGIYIPAVTTGRWILSFNVVGYNPSVVGGLEITEIMLRPAGTDDTYVPYAMTNRELTEKVKGIYKNYCLLTMSGGTESINISAFDTGRPYIIMCSGHYNPLWHYMGLLCITEGTEGSNGYLFDIVTDPTLTVSVSGNTLTLRNNNYENDQVVGVTIMG